MNASRHGDSDATDAWGRFVEIISDDPFCEARTLDMSAHRARIEVSLRPDRAGEPSHMGKGPWSVGMRAARAVDVHVMSAERTDGGSYVFDLAAGERVSGIASRVIHLPDRVLLTLRPDPDCMDPARTPDPDEVHAVRVPGDRSHLRVRMTAPGDRVCIVSPPTGAWENALMTNGSTEDLRWRPNKEGKERE